MVTNLKISPETEVFYPSEDDEPLAETTEHLLAIINTFTALTQYLAGQGAMVFSNQFLYYVKGQPSKRVAPDIMIVFDFDIAPGLRSNYKIWEEGQVPKFIMEMTSQGNRDNDHLVKKSLYEELGVEEYWLFDPKKEWISDQLIGYRLQEGVYHTIRDSRSETLQLNFVPEGSSLNFYRLDNGLKLLIPDELFRALQAETLARQEVEGQAEILQQEAEILQQEAEMARQQTIDAEQRAAELEAMLDRYRHQFGDLPSN